MARSVRAQASPEGQVLRARPRRQPRLTTQVALLYPYQGEWSEADYLALPETNRIVELSEGRLVVPEMPTDPHQYAVGELFAAIHSFVRGRAVGYVRVAPLPVRLWPGKFREPDIVFLSREHGDRRGEQFWGVPDLVVEVISPRTEHSSGTERADRREKFEEYARAGVSECWLVDPRGCTIEVYVLREEVYHLLGKWGLGEVACSEVLKGFEVPVAAVLTEEE
jgi:Uma2 family endonuclease